ncbi:MAG: DNA gyrase inhibitor YacG [Deltaproteobacteria bacterium]|nr:MAG: DNA gyrase inhibitor YacG [Deltaproteobacteria bacterium]
MTFTPRCPTCHEAVVWEANPFRPFCSERCRLIDLGAWVTERYRVPGEPADRHDGGDDTDEGGGG